jgi:hypothetical protein
VRGGVDKTIYGLALHLFLALHPSVKLRQRYIPRGIYIPVLCPRCPRWFFSLMCAVNTTILCHRIQEFTLKYIHISMGDVSLITH